MLSERAKGMSEVYKAIIKASKPKPRKLQVVALPDIRYGRISWVMTHNLEQFEYLNGPQLWARLKGSLPQRIFLLQADRWEKVGHSLWKRRVRHDGHYTRGFN
jgi:hypothetical protein